MRSQRIRQKQPACSATENGAAPDLMEKGVDSTHPDFWTSRYVAGKTPWDFGGVPAALKSFLIRSSAPALVTRSKRSMRPATMSQQLIFRRLPLTKPREDWEF